MSEIRDLYQQTILDHNKAPRNFRKMENADKAVEGYNPLCGDHYTVFLKFEKDTIADISFQGSGCAISKASASVMSSMLKGKSKAEAEEFFQKFHDLITGKISSQEHLDALGKLTAFSGVCEFPSRVKCAILAWHTLRAGVHENSTTVTTE